MLLYHGTSTINALGILNKGFDKTKVGTNWGKTYGNGIYFTPNYDTARVYAGDAGIILSFHFDVTDCHKLIKYNRSGVKIKSSFLNKKWIITPDNDEYILIII